MDDDTWMDPSPHTSVLLKTPRGHFHVLDWGGNGATVLLLPGFGNTVHIFDDLAPLLTDRYRVLALTRRGHGQSVMTATGYEAEDLATDVAQVLADLGVPHVHLIGHSMAGAEMSCFAAQYADRLSSLIYLDAAYDFADSVTVWQDDPVVPLPPPSNVERASFTSLARYYTQHFGFWSAAQEADLHAVYVRGADDLLHFRMSDPVRAALHAGYTNARPRYATIAVPALAIYAVYDRYPFLPDDADAELRGRAQAFFDRGPKVWQRREISRFQTEMRHGHILELVGANHFCFIDRQPMIVRAITCFLAGDHPVP